MNRLKVQRIIDVLMPDMPPRTSIQVELPEFMLRAGQDIDARLLDVRYECMDCGWATMDRNLMVEHQANQRNYHTIWQRLRRWALMPCPTFHP